MRPFAVGGIATLLKKIPTAAVVPVAIDGTWRLTRFGTFPLSFGEKVSFTVLKPIEPGTKEAAEVISEAEEAIKTIIND
jgi:1-acyl-sn-glycerol-3-phosphate acyltransferase